MRLAIFQLRTAWEDKEKNKRRILELSEGCHADWLVFPEMTLSGFSMDVSAATLLPEDIEFFRKLSRRYRSAVTFGAVVANHNKSLTYDKKGRRIADYSKIHLFSFAGEDKHYKRGRKMVIFRLGGIRVCPLVCYDLRFPNLFFQRAEVFVIIANWPWARIDHWKTLLRARAIENQAFVIGVNRVGRDPNVSYPGNSMVVEPDGSVALECGGKEAIFEVAIDPSRVERVRKRFPVLKDFRRV